MAKSAFGKWLVKLNAEVAKWGGPAEYDMPPLDYYGYFGDGSTPKEVADKVYKIEVEGKTVEEAA